MLVTFRSSYIALIGIPSSIVFLMIWFHLSSTNNVLPLPYEPQDADVSYRNILANIRPSDTQPHSRTLGIAHIYVLSLPHRIDRRRSMNTLARALDLDFEFVDGLEATDDRVDYALDILRKQRKDFVKYTHGKLVFPGFAFPSLSDDDHPDDARGKASPDSWGFSDAYSLPFLFSSAFETAPPNPIDRNFTPVYGEELAFPCATPEDPFPDLLNKSEISLLQPWRILSRGMIACWLAHLRMIHKIANLPDVNAVAIVFEDDVDMEFDIERRMQRVWPALPRHGWDIIMLGYCHSNEMVHSPIAGAASVRPSFAPKCTHAYAMSRAGARRLIRILSTPGFAFSRAIDQAISWLIKTQTIRSYSIVPAIVIQRKLTPSDIWGAGGLAENSSRKNGSEWRDVLVDSTLERVEMAQGLHITAANG